MELIKCKQMLLLPVYKSDQNMVILNAEQTTTEESEQQTSVCVFVCVCKSFL